MKNIYLVLGILVLNTLSIYAQEKTDGCGNFIRKISTNPENPINEEWSSWYPNDVGSYINTGFSWYPGNQVVIPKEQNWNSEFLRNGNDIIMPWFFSNSNTETGHLYYHPDSNIHYLDKQEQDWHWEDGWELLYLNIGILPNGTQLDQKSDPSMYWNTDSEQPTANNSPYVVFYNRYTGLMRVFFSAWGDDANNWQDVTVSLEFPKTLINEKVISGVFRHAEGTDRPLNEPTRVTKLKGARKQRINGPNEWYVAEFQLGYDVCQCQFASNMLLKFKYSSKSEVDLNLRTIALEQGIANLEDDYWNFFQNMYDEEGNLTEAGNVLYPTMSSLSSSYESALTKYNDDLEDYNSFKNQLKTKVISALTDGVAGGIAGLAVPQTALLRDFMLNNQLKIGKNKILLPHDTTQAKNWVNSIEASAKKALAEESDFISGMLGIKEEPSPPQMPVATFTEGKIEGSITDHKEQTSVPLIVPGSMKIPNGISGQNFPAYNQVVGLLALLEMPRIKTNFEHHSGSAECGYFGELNYTTQLSDVSVALNPAIDFNLDKTKINVALVFDFVGAPDQFGDALTNKIENSNFTLNHYYKEDGKLHYEFVSDFYLLEDLENVIFKLNANISGCGGYEFDPKSQTVRHWGIKEGTTVLSLESVKLKIAADMYFDQIGSNNELVNTFQVFTYNIWDKEAKLPNRLSFPDAIDYFKGEVVSNDNWVTYLPGNLELSGIVQPTDNFVWTVSGTDIIVRAENVNIINDVGPAEGYNLIIEAMNINLDPDATLLDNTELLSKWFYDYPLTKPIISAQDLPEGYCSQTYKANETIASKREITNEEKIPEFYKKDNIAILMFPNPVNQEVNVKVTSGELTSCTIKVMSITGQTLIQERVNDDLVNGFAIGVEHLTNGYYILELFSDEGYRVQKKFVVQH